MAGLDGDDASKTVDLPPAAAGNQLRLGTVVGRYVVLEGLAAGGMGGMGIVYAAYDPDLYRRVAIKFLLSNQANHTGHDRLLREARAMAQLSHPNVVAVYDVGTWQERVFIAMELVDGGTLKGWLAGDRSCREILDTFIAAGRGLAAAHAAGLVHRDFKPSNVMVGHDGRVRVTDFGLVRAAGASSAENPDSTGQRFALAQALWQSGDDQHDRALELGRQARDEYSGLWNGKAALSAVEQWLARHEGPRAAAVQAPR